MYGVAEGEVNGVGRSWNILSLRGDGIEKREEDGDEGVVVEFPCDRSAMNLSYAFSCQSSHALVRTGDGGEDGENKARFSGGDDGEESLSSCESLSRGSGTDD